MSRGQIKSKVVQSTINSADVMEMFHGVLGTGEGTELKITIVYPKYLKIVEHCSRYMRLLEALRDSSVMEHFPAESNHFAAYIVDLREQAANVLSAPDLAALHPAGPMERMMDQTVSYPQITREEYDAFAEVYKGIKDSNLVNTIVVTCNNLVPHKKSLEDAETLKDRFLIRSAGLTFAPLPGLPAMNFKKIYISDQLSPEDRSFILMVLHKLFTISHDLYDTMSSPDIDVDEFVQVILGSLDDVKKHIPRCNEAFDKIRDSVGLLKGNFGGYYKDFVATNNPTIIMENFVLDVSKNTKSSAKVTAQFRRIISHYKTLATQQAQNPKMKSLFAHVDKNFQELEKRSRQADAESDDSADAEKDEIEGDAPPADEKLDADPPTPEPREARRKKVVQQLEAAIAAVEVGLGEELDGLTLSEMDATDSSSSVVPDSSAVPDGE